MSLTDLYKNSSLARIVAVRDIPEQATNMIDIENQFQKEFAPGDKPGQPTRFTSKALDSYNKKVKDLTPPQGTTAPIHQYSPEKKYYNPGSPK